MTVDVTNVTDVAVSWDAPPGKDLAGYYVYYGRNYGEKLYISNVLSYTFVELSPHFRFFAVTAIDYAGNESKLSNETVLNRCFPNHQGNIFNGLSLLIRIYIKLNQIQTSIKTQIGIHFFS